MVDISTKYLNLQLKNPLIAASSGLTNSAENIQKLEEKGIGAVVLKSIFEEQITGEINHTIKQSASNAPSETEDYITNYIKDTNLERYLNFINQTKKSTQIPIIASINCITKGDWISFAKKVEQAGADALEVNIFILPINSAKKSIEYEQIYFDTLRAIKKKVKIPVSIKLGMHFTNLISFTEKLHAYGADGIVMFNRFYEPDIDIENLSLSTAPIYSHPIEIRKSLRWVGLLYNKIKGLSISTSTGVHDSEAVIKLLLAGADTIQLCSLLYQKGLEEVPKLLQGLESWLNQKQYRSIDEFRGKLSYQRLENPALYERSQFMKYFSSDS